MVKHDDDHLLQVDVGASLLGQPDVALFVPPLNNDPFLEDVEHKTKGRYSGVICWIVLLLLMVSIALCLEISSYAFPQRRDISQAFNIVYMLSGAVYMMGLYWCRQSLAYRGGSRGVESPRVALYNRDGKALVKRKNGKIRKERKTMRKQRRN